MMTNKQKSLARKREEAIKLRKHGIGLKEIADYLWISTTSAFLYTKGIKEEKEVTKFDPKVKLAKVANDVSLKYKPYTWGNPDNVLVIGDLHSPWILRGYLEFCLEQQKKFNCGTVIFIGDILDSQASNFHESNPDLPSAWDELTQAIVKLQPWFKSFPKAYITNGNHDLIFKRKAFSGWLSSRTVRSVKDIIWAPDTWRFVDHIILNNVFYTHGTKGNAYKKAISDGISTVQGHLHTDSFVHYHLGRKQFLFGMQVGCGIDAKQMAFDYAKPNLAMAVMSCGVVLESGTLPIVLPMNNTLN